MSSKIKIKHKSKPKNKVSVVRPAQKQKKKVSFGAKVANQLLSSGIKGAASFLAHVTGMGAYRVKGNSFAVSPDQVPVFEPQANGDVIITHSECLGDVLSSTTFLLSSYLINPTDPRTFPWLSTQSGGFEQFEFQGLLFAFKSTSATAVSSTNTALGTVVMATEYDLSRLNFQNKIEMEAYEFSCSACPTEHQLHPVECSPKEDIINSRYVGSQYRTQAASTYDLTSATGATSEVSLAANLNNLGRFQIAVVGMQAGSITLGELWVTYKVKLMKPRLLSLGLKEAVYHISSGIDTSYVIPSGVAPFNSTTYYKTINDSTLGLQTLGVVSGGSSNRLGVVGLPIGTKLMCVYIATAGAAPTISANFSAVSGCSASTQAFPSAVSNTFGGVYSAVDAALNNIICLVGLVTTADTAIFAIPYVNAVGGYAFDLRVTIVPPYNGPSTGTPYLSMSAVVELEARMRKLELYESKEMQPEAAKLSHQQSLSVEVGDVLPQNPRDVKVSKLSSDRVIIDQSDDYDLTDEEEKLTPLPRVTKVRVRLPPLPNRMNINETSRVGCNPS